MRNLSRDAYGWRLRSTFCVWLPLAIAAFTVGAEFDEEERTSGRRSTPSWPPWDDDPRPPPDKVDVAPLPDPDRPCALRRRLLSSELPIG